ncbi:MAG: TolC family protein [Planctomycetota bacterium]|jgi:cobalt-zinc-cadmium efflux system outer membrane protein
MIRLILVLVFAALAACADLPEERLETVRAEPGRSSPLRMEYLKAAERAEAREAPLPTEVQPGAFSLNRLLALVETSPRITVLRERIEQETGAALQGSLAPNPVLHFETERMPIDDMGFGNAMNKVGISQRFETAGKAGARVSLALARKDEAEAHFFHWRNVLMEEVARDFAEAWFAMEKGKALDRMLALRKELFEKASALQEQGRLSEQELLSYEVAVEKAAADRKSFSAEERRLLRTLEGRLGLTSGTIRSLEGAPFRKNAPDAAQASADIMSRNCELIVLDRKLVTAHSDKDSQERLAYTDLNVGVTYMRGPEGFRDRDDFLGGFVDIPFPLVDRNQGGIQRAEAAVREIEAEMEAEMYRLLDEWHGLDEQWRIKNGQLGLYKDKIIPFLEEELALTKNQVDAGRMPVQRSLEASLKLEEAVLAKLDLEESLALFEVRMNYLVGSDYQ